MYLQQTNSSQDYFYSNGGRAFYFTLSVVEELRL